MRQPTQPASHSQPTQVTRQDSRSWRCKVVRATASFPIPRSLVCWSAAGLEHERGTNDMEIDRDCFAGRRGEICGSVPLSGTKRRGRRGDACLTRRIGCMQCLLRLYISRVRFLLIRTLNYIGTAAISLPPIKAVKNTCSFEAGCIQELNLASAPPRVSPGRTMNLNY